VQRVLACCRQVQGKVLRLWDHGHERCTPAGTRMQHARTLHMHCSQDALGCNKQRHMVDAVCGSLADSETLHLLGLLQPGDLCGGPKNDGFCLGGYL
jgi:hypothetical protein